MKYKYRRLLMPEYLFTWTVYFLTLLWAIVIHFSDFVNNNRGSYPERFLIVLSLHSALFGALFFWKKIVLDNLKSSIVPFVLFFSILFFGAIRGLPFQYLLMKYGFTEGSSYPQRAWASSLNTTLSFVLVTATVSNFRFHMATRNRLLLEKSRLEYVQKEAIDSLVAVGPDVVDEIKSGLLRKVQEMYTSNIPMILTQIRSTIDEVVRPVSRSLNEKSEPWNPPNFEFEQVKINWRSTYKESIKPSSIDFKFVPILMCILPMPTIVDRSSPLVAFVLYPCIVAVGFLLGYLAVQIFAAKSNSAVLTLMLTVFIGALIGGMTLTFTSSWDERYSLFLQAIIFYPTWSFVISFLKTLLRLDFEANEQLEEVTNNLAWNVARVRQQKFQTQKSLAATLHGEVQAKLASTHLQLEALMNSDSASQDQIDHLLKELQATVEKIDSVGSSGHDLNEMFEKVKENWLQVAQISVNVAPQLLKKIEQDKICAATLVEVIPELCFNGIKHGGATQISISLALKSPRIVEVTVTNNGSREKGNTPDGLGTKFLNEVSINSERIEENGLTVTRAELAYSANELAVN